MSRAGRALAAAAVLLALVAARMPLHRATHALPVSNDDAVPLLMASHLLRGELSTILWNQPYNGTLDTYLLAPFVALLGAHEGFRAYEALCGLLLVIAAGLLGRQVAGEAAGWTAALMAAVGTPYMALMAATGPTPNFLMPLLCALPAWMGLRRLGRAPASAARGAALLSGLVCGAAFWNSALALPALSGIGAGLLLAGLRPRPGSVATLAAGIGVGAAPLVAAAVLGASASSPVTALRPRWLWLDGLADLGRAAAGLFGMQVPLVVDGPERAGLPALAVAALAAGLLVLVVLGARHRRSLPLLCWAAALAAAFAASRRTGGDEVRYLYGLTVPVLALAGAGGAVLLRRPGAARIGAGLLVAATVVPWSLGHRVVLAHWRDPQHAARVWQVPPLDPVRDTLRRAGVRSAYASLQFAGRLTLETGGAVVASQAWNERIPGDPLRFRDEVDLDPRPAWVLSHHLSRGMPRAAGFRALLGAMGGGWKEDLPGEFAVFRRFVPPYDESRPVPRGALAVGALDGGVPGTAVLDRDPDTWWSAGTGLARGSGLAVRVQPARRLSALVLLVDLRDSPLAVPWVAEVDGAVVSRGPVRHVLQWVNGAPRAGKQALLVAPLGDRTAGEVRLIFQDAGPVLRVAEVFVYGPDEANAPPAGAAAAERALERARAGEWTQAAAGYADALRLEPDRASFHACRQRAQWRAQKRRWIDVEGLDDGGEAFVGAR